MRKIVFKVSEVVLRDVEVVEEHPDVDVVETFYGPVPQAPAKPSAREVELAEEVAKMRDEVDAANRAVAHFRGVSDSLVDEKGTLVKTCDHLREKLEERDQRMREAEAKAADMPSLRQGHIDKERTITGLRQTLEREQALIATERRDREEQVARLRRQIQTAREEGEATAAELRGRLEAACAPGIVLTPDELALVIKEIDIGVAHGRIRRDAVGQAVIEKLYAARGDT